VVPPSVVAAGLHPGSRNRVEGRGDDGVVAGDGSPLDQSLDPVLNRLVHSHGRADLSDLGGHHDPVDLFQSIEPRPLVLVG